MLTLPVAHRFHQWISVQGVGSFCVCVCFFLICLKFISLAASALFQHAGSFTVAHTIFIYGTLV